jgi:hypothetical protein
MRGGALTRPACGLVVAQGRLIVRDRRERHGGRRRDDQGDRRRDGSIDDGSACGSREAPGLRVDVVGQWYESIPEMDLKRGLGWCDATSAMSVSSSRRAAS